MSDPITQAKNEVDDYDLTVKSLLAFAALVVHDGRSLREGAEFGIGRRMTTSPVNSVSPHTMVTPDLVAQKDGRFGVVAEVKAGRAQDPRQWEEAARQLRKYDDELTGWWTEDEKMVLANAVILVHYSRSRRLVETLKRMAQQTPEKVGARSCLVEYQRSSQRVEYIAFRLEYGNVLDAELSSRLSDCVDVPLEKVLGTFPNLRFCDCEPPLAFMLIELWTDVFAAKAAGLVRDERLRARRMLVTVDELTSELQSAYGSATLRLDSRSVEFPRKTWVRKALDALVTYGLAERKTEAADTYEVFYRQLRGDILERFVQLGAAQKPVAQASGAPREEPLFRELAEE